jgi:hypothetical protein
MKKEEKTEKKKKIEELKEKKHKIEEKVDY